MRRAPSADAVPPRHSHIDDPDGRYWCCTLDGIPVAHCTEFDVDEGWVQVYVVADGPTGKSLRILDVPQRRLHGEVEAIPCAEFYQKRKDGPSIEIRADRLRGDPVPGTELRRRAR